MIDPGRLQKVKEVHQLLVELGIDSEDISLSLFDKKAVLGLGRRGGPGCRIVIDLGPEKMLGHYPVRIHGPSAEICEGRR